MAKAGKRPAPGRTGQRRSRGSVARGRGRVRLAMLMFSVLSIVLLVFAAPALIVLLVGMVPTAVAITVDRDPLKNASISVAALNFAGVSPYLAGFLFGSDGFAYALDLISNVFALVVMYGAAAVGWVMVNAMPRVSAIVLGVTTDARIQALRKEQRQLIDEWGKAVAEP